VVNFKPHGVQLLDLSLHFADLVKFRVPTGNIAMDIVTGGGIPAGKFTEVYGDFSSGKTRLVCHIAAETQKLGGIVIFLDVERSLAPGLLDLTGVDRDSIVSVNPDEELLTLEDTFEVMEKLITQIKKNHKDLLVTFILDSIAVIPCKDELTGDLGGRMVPARRAAIIGSGLRRIAPEVHRHKICMVFVNQLRDNVGVMFGEQASTVGGRALKFQYSLRLHCRITKQIKDAQTKEVTGYEGRISVDKSKVCRPFGVVNFEMLADYPIDPYSGLLDYFVRHGKLIDKGKGNYASNVGDTDVSFKKKSFPEYYNNNKELFK